MSYVAKCPGCGGVTAAMSPDLPKQFQAKTIAGWVRRGDEVHRMEVEAVRKADWHCKCVEREG